MFLLVEVVYPEVLEGEVEQRGEQESRGGSDEYIPEPRHSHLRTQVLAVLNRNNLTNSHVERQGPIVHRSSIEEISYYKKNLFFYIRHPAGYPVSFSVYPDKLLNKLCKL